jgi:hypothetical protein
MKIDFKQIQNQTVKLKPEDGKIKGSVTFSPPTIPLASETCSNKNWNIDVLSVIYENVTCILNRKILISCDSIIETVTITYEIRFLEKL